MVLRPMALTIAVLTAVGALACGPSLRRVADSQVYFERCYAADFDTRIPLTEKHACWTAWREHYTQGQPQERVQYAQQRVEDLDNGVSVPLLPGLPEAAVGPRRQTPLTVASSSPDPAESGEPGTAEDGSGVDVHEGEVDVAITGGNGRPSDAERRRRYPPPLPRTSNRICAQRACEPQWRECLDTCPDSNEACETACTVELQTCARGCY